MNNYGLSYLKSIHLFEYNTYNT